MEGSLAPVTYIADNGLIWHKWGGGGRPSIRSPALCNTTGVPTIAADSGYFPAGFESRVSKATGGSHGCNSGR